MNHHVWTLHIEAEGPIGGDWDGTDSVHATRKSAEHAVFDFVHSLGIDPRDPDVSIVRITAQHQDDTQTCIDFETANGWTGHYGIHRMEVKA